MRNCGFKSRRRVYQWIVGDGTAIVCVNCQARSRPFALIRVLGWKLCFWWISVCPDGRDRDQFPTADVLVVLLPQFADRCEFCRLGSLANRSRCIAPRPACGSTAVPRRGRSALPKSPPGISPFNNKHHLININNAMCAHCLWSLIRVTTEILKIIGELSGYFAYL